MNGRAVLAASALVVTMLAAGCASGSGGSVRQAASAAPAGLSAATSLTISGSGGTWAVIPMGGTGPNLFWQLFSLPAANGQWSLKTPPAVATNGALIAAPQDGAGKGAQALTVGIRPSLNLLFSPVTVTRDGGRDWSTIAPASGSRTSPTPSRPPRTASSSR